VPESTSVVSEATPLAPEPKAAPIVTGGSTLRILLVDDAEDNRLLVQTYLKKTPHELILAIHGEEAVQLIMENTFDLVFMDVQMPVMDGYSATRLIRQWEAETRKPRLPIVTLTAHALEGEVERSRAAGCDAFLIKPISKKKLLEVIRQFAESRS
ncbi:MAG: response regulator, partial [Magnetococcales bacterium]|nr:response regulator [Magnetococcales bacterium]